MEEKVTEKETTVERDRMPDPAEEHRVTPPDTTIRETEVERTVDNDPNTDDEDN
jgi:hypothetical protein